MAVTMSDIAKRAKVSTATVSYVLNGQKNQYITPKTRDCIQDAVREMGYVPNRAARALATGKNNAIGLWAFEIRAQYYANLIHNISHCLYQRNYDVHLLETNNSRNPDMANRAITSLPVDGIIAFDSPIFVEAYLKAHQNGGKPVVSIGGAWTSKTDFVGIDRYVGTIDAIQHLIKTGRKRIAYIVPKTHNHQGDGRHDAYFKTMQEAGLVPECILVDCPIQGIERHTVREVVKKYVKVLGCPEAVFCFNDEGAIAAYRAFRDLSLDIPRDVAIVGCDGIEDTEYLDVPISTLAVPSEELTNVAWEFLERRIAKPDIPQQKTILKTKLVIRESSRA
jgi:DNA-binding LacI/PurR family transcriptional regulator